MSTHTWRPGIPETLIAVLLLTTGATVPVKAGSNPEPPPIPADVRVLLVGHPDLSGGDLSDYRATFSMGRHHKEGPMQVGETVRAGAFQESVLERVEVDGRRVLRRSSIVKLANGGQVVGRASIDMDAETLLPLRASSEQGGVRTDVVYDWQASVVRRSPGPDGSETREDPIDMEMLEVGAHDVWMAALPLSEGFSARIPTVFAPLGVKYWAVPRVVGSEPIELGDGHRHAAWVVELDWWGMGAANTLENYSPGGGANGSGGTGGKYWVLKEPVPGKPRVVRVRTEIGPEQDSVIQIQGGA